MFEDLGFGPARPLGPEASGRLGSWEAFGKRLGAVPVAQLWFWILGSGFRR